MNRKTRNPLNNSVRQLRTPPGFWFLRKADVALEAWPKGLSPFAFESSKLGFSASRRL